MIASEREAFLSSSNELGREKESAAGDGRPRAKGGGRNDQPEAAASIHHENTQPTLVLFFFLCSCS
jgi:hypothetical protein